jgi:hypothetical protein
MPSIARAKASAEKIFSIIREESQIDSRQKSLIQHAN